MQNCTNEQLKYINFFEKKNTKLIACAGSGKTRCILLKMNNIIKNNIFKKSELLMLTFSKPTKDDFIKKINDYKINVDENNVKTIDSFAKKLIDKDNKIDVSLLSFKFMNYLKDTPKDILKKNKNLTIYKIIFVDEAQDLNNTQFLIFKYLNEKLDIIINLIGDPNQNIYQFRGSSDKYLKDFDSNTFYLSKNFRSKKCIVDFCNYLRPYDSSKIECTQGDNNCKPILMFYKNEKIIEDNIISILRSATNNNIDLSDIAILSPTRGKMSGFGKSHGLCLISNILFKEKIKFKQFYDESTDDFGSNIKYKPKKNHVNLLTYMGSKGLEWKYVIIIDADMCLINKRYFDEEKHNNDKYLLYVACSRAIENMYIFSKTHSNKGIIEFNTNPWFNLIPKNFYNIDKNFLQEFFFPKIKYIDLGDNEKRITKIIDRFDEYDLDQLSKIINFDNKKIIFHENIFKNDYSSNNNSFFLGKYLELLFQIINNIKLKRPNKKFHDIENIVNSVVNPNNIMEKVPINVSQWYSSNKKNITWDKFDNDKSIDSSIKDFVNKNFSRKKELNHHTIINDSYFKWYILSKRNWISNIYNKYINCTNPYKIKKYKFFIIVINHSFETQHYYHIKTKGKMFSKILDHYENLINDLINFVFNNNYCFTDYNISINDEYFFGEADLIDKDNSIWEIKCVNEVTLKHFLQVIIYNIIYYDLINNNKKKNKIILKFINLIKGEIIFYQLDLSNKILTQFYNLFKQKLQINP